MGPMQTLSRNDRQRNPRWRQEDKSLFVPHDVFQANTLSLMLGILSAEDKGYTVDAGELTGPFGLCVELSHLREPNCPKSRAQRGDRRPFLRRATFATASSIFSAGPASAYAEI